MSKLLNSALAYAGRGFSVIPVRGKKPIVKWEQYQKQRADTSQIRRWWKQHPDAGIGIVTGAISQLYVVDADGPAGIKWIAENTTLKPTVKSPRKGYHYYTSGGNGLRNATGFLPELDFRGEGGYIVAPPTRTDKGAYIPMGTMPKSFPSVPETIRQAILAPSGTLQAPFGTLGKIDGTLVAPSKHPLSTLPAPLAPCLTQGKRDETIFHLANCLIKGGMSVEDAQAYCCLVAGHCTPPFPAAEAIAKVTSAVKRGGQTGKSVRQQITEWVEQDRGSWYLQQLYLDLGYTTKEEKKYARKVVQVLKEKGTIESIGPRRGEYRRVNNEAPVIDIRNVDTNSLEILYPLNIEQFFRTMPKNIILIAGEQDSGKSAFALNFAAMNVGRGVPVRYCSSEMGAVELADRLSKIKGYGLEHLCQIDFRERQAEFHDLILPDGINIIDFLEVTDQFWLIGDWLNNIHLKLKSGIALVLIQKDDQKEYGRGASFGKEKPRLYLTLENNYPAGHVAKVKKCKNWVNSNWNPNGKRIEYKIVDGIQMRVLTKWEV